MRIYTKTGDSGMTGLLGGGRIPKQSPTMDAIGAVDELNAAIGMARAVVRHTEVGELLAWTQQRLFCLGAELAAATDRQGPNPVEQADVARYEASMDAMESEVAPLRNFILPGGTESAARLHVARTVCRRAERCVWNWLDGSNRRQDTAVFLNRLSDWLFVAARVENAVDGTPETVWNELEQK